MTVVSTTPSSSAEVCYVADVRAASSGTPVRFRALPADRYAAGSIFSILRQARPRIVLNCASYQSPWQKTRSPSAWTALMNSAGFGLTLPIYGRSLALDLPADMPPAQAVALNSAWAERDGVSVEENGEVRFSAWASRAIRSELPDFPSTAHARDIPELCSRLLDLRGRLRRTRAASADHH
ncbi:hypothetical protein [Streptosporangium roseum]|uniref:hypothetical protein n=1 Tax=Streptosporangium roseum TaxID=2001 RepID=UPI003328CA7F